MSEQSVVSSFQRRSDTPSDTVHYFYPQLYRYLVHVEVEDCNRRRGSASMWVHVALAVRLGSPMSMYVPLRRYIEEEGPNRGLADPEWRPEYIDPNEYLNENALVKAHVVSVAVQGQRLPYEYSHQRTLRGVDYPRVDPIWGTLEIHPLLQQVGVTASHGTVFLMEHTGGWVNRWRYGVWWVPDGTYLWPQNTWVSSTPTKAYWWNYWTQSPYNLQKPLHFLRATAKLGWMETWDLAAISVISGKVKEKVRDNDRINSTLSWVTKPNPCRPWERMPLLLGGDHYRRLPAPARLEAAEVSILHPWRSSPDVWQRDMAQRHRKFIEIGIVQSVEGFDRGYFEYRLLQAPRYPRLWWDVGKNPPLFDKIGCPGERNFDAWYATGKIEYPIGSGTFYYSYLRMDDKTKLPADSWTPKIGYEDSPAFPVFPETSLPPYNLPVSILGISQNSTPTLYFYAAIAGRTYFFPYSYVPIRQLKGWKINFNGLPDGWGWYGWDQYGEIGIGSWNTQGYQNSGARDYNPTLEQPETVYGSYNQLSRSEWR